MRDSNPRKRSQSPVCYRYTNPLYHRMTIEADIIIVTFEKKSREFFGFREFFCQRGRIGSVPAG